MAGALQERTSLTPLDLRGNRLGARAAIILKYSWQIRRPPGYSFGLFLDTDVAESEHNAEEEEEEEEIDATESLARE